MTPTAILNTKETVKGLCKLASDLGYKDPLHQLINSDGSVVGDLLAFFEDNPGACQAVIEWAAENHGEESEINEITGTEHDGLCEECDEPLTRDNLTEGDLGFYCSQECWDEAESGPSHDFREDFHSDG